MSQKNQFKAEDLQFLFVDTKVFSINLNSWTYDFTEGASRNVSIATDITSYQAMDSSLKRIAFGLILELSMSSVGEPKDIPKLKADFMFHFTYEKLEKVLIPNKEGKASLPQWLVEILGSISYSTARGMILEKANGTIFSGFALPITSPKTIIAKQLK